MRCTTPRTGALLSVMQIVSTLYPFRLCVCTLARDFWPSSSVPSICSYIRCVDCIRDIREKRAKSKVLEVDGTSDDYEAPRIHATHKHSHHSSSGDRGPIVSGPVMPEARSGASPRIELTPMGTNGPPPITGQPVAPSPLAPLPPVGVRPPAGGPGVGGRRGLAPLGPSALPPIRK